MPSLVRAAALAILAACVLSSQPPAPSGLPPADEPFRAGVNMVQEPMRVGVNLVDVDAVVHDSKRRYPSDLRREDFEIREDGKLQEITSFSYQALPRNIAVFVDNCDSWAVEWVGVRGGLGSLLHEFIEQRLKLDDRIAVLPCLEGSDALHKLSGERELLHRAEVVSFTEPDWLPDLSYWWLMWGELSRLTSSRGQPNFMGVASFEAIRSAVDGLSMLPGRKILVVVSSFEGWNRVDKDSLKIRELAERVNRSGIVLYVLDPGGGSSYVGDWPANASSASSGTLMPVTLDILPQEGNSQALDTLAEASGGFAVHLGFSLPSGTAGEGDLIAGAWPGIMRAFLKEGLERIDQDSSGYYLISYNPGALEAQRNRLHRIEVRTRRPGLTVRARNGYYARSETAPRAKPQTPDEQFRAAVLATLQGAGLPFRMRLFDHVGEPAPRTGQRRPVVRAMLAIDPRDLTLQPQPDGSRRAVVEVRAAAFGGEIEAAATTSATCSAKAPAGDLERRRLVCSLDLPLPKPGAYVVRAAVMDVASGRIGSAWTTGKMLYYPPDELSLSQMTVTLAPTVLGAPAGEIMATDSNPVDAVFAPGATLAYAVDVYRPRPNRRKTPKLVAKVALSRYMMPPSRSGYRFETGGRYPSILNRLYYLSELLPIQVEESSATAIVRGKLSLPSGLEPGVYHLLVAVYDLSVTSKGAIEKDIKLRFAGGRGPWFAGGRGGGPFLFADAFITVAPAGGPAPAWVHDPMGYVRPLNEKYPSGLP